MQADPAVASALNDSLLLEITFFEVVHAQEHVFRRKKYKDLRSWYDGHVDKSRTRRRWLTDRLFRLDAPATIAMRSTVVNPADAPEFILAATMTAAQELLASYQAGHLTAGSAGDCVTAYGLCDLVKDVEGLVGCLESFAGQIEDVGIQQFLAQKIKS
jgi:bacterioferritin (cytochrome b1)